MASVVVSGDTSGSVTLSAPAVAGTTTLTLPTFNGTVGLLVSGTAVASTSGTSIDFTSLPTTARRITINFNNVSLSGTASFLVQIGNNTPTTSGYSAITTYNTGAGVGVLTSTSGIPIQAGAATYLTYGSLVITNVSGNIWTASGVLGNTTTVTYTVNSSGIISLGSALNMVRITTTNGTDTFDAGTINILYE